MIAACFYAFCILSIVLFRWVTPPTTSVQIQRRLQTWSSGKPYHKQYSPVPLSQISLSLQHAVVAAEDTRFYQHHGFDWVEVEKVMEQSSESGHVSRGASTITQQLVKNLFLTTERSFIRKGIEASLVPVMEAVLSKNRILNLYLNAIEWGPGVYGVQAASQHYYQKDASHVGREEAARLAAVIPAPLHRRPAQMGGYSAEILARMSAMGW
ncbi:MAG TPA: monofunctional biosynthetic peptidoglycan transglycosylase [Bryobacteraceae bacterium]|nr:monofunctional biosynthetic peptidoglycan transglycosylase [Bryobacteraceae bacterium]